MWRSHCKVVTIDRLRQISGHSGNHKALGPLCSYYKMGRLGWGCSSMCVQYIQGPRFHPQHCPEKGEVVTFRAGKRWGDDMVTETVKGLM